MSNQLVVGAVVMVGLHLLLAGVAGWRGLGAVLACGVVGGLVGRMLSGTSVAYATCVQGLLTMLYLHFYVGVDRSVSIRILNELSQSPGHRLTMRELDRRYPQRYMFEHRVALLERYGWVLQNNGHYAAAPWTKPIVDATRHLRNLFRLQDTW